MLVVIGAVTVVVAWAGREPIKARIGTPAGRLLLSRVAGATVIVAFVVLLSRPWWMTARGEFDNLILRVAQQAQGLPVDGTRLYAEYTVNWQAMYFGWPTVILAVLGYVVLLYRLIRRSDYRLLGFLVMTLSLSALYLWTPQITPDQVWAMRRYVPVVVPGLIIAAVAALRAAWTWWTTSSAVRVVVRGGVIVACAAVLVVPWLVTRPVRDLREEAPQAAASSRAVRRGTLRRRRAGRRRESAVGLLADDPVVLRRANSRPCRRLVRVRWPMQRAR